MTDDLVQRLREMSRRGYWPLLGDEAADEIERLRAEIKALHADIEIAYKLLINNDPIGAMEIFEGQHRYERPRKT